MTKVVLLQHGLHLVLVARVIYVFGEILASACKSIRLGTLLAGAVLNLKIEFGEEFSPSYLPAI
jgi:hypothetical protein